MAVIDDIFNIEDKEIVIDKDWYYHAFTYDEVFFSDMIKNGLKCSFLTRRPYGGNNGKYYISLTKNMNIDPSIEKSAYNSFSCLPMFILDKNIKVLDASLNNSYPYWMSKSILPFRESDYLDEFQAFFRIKSDKIIAIAYNLYEDYEKYGYIYTKGCLEVLKSIVTDLDRLDISIPIIDPKMKLEINKDKVLKLK